MGFISAVTPNTPGATQSPAEGCFSFLAGRGEGIWRTVGPRLLIRTPSHAQVHLQAGAPTLPTSCAAKGTELWRNRPFLSF